MRGQKERSEWVTDQWREYKSKRNPWPFSLVCISSWIYLFLAPVLLTLWSKLLSSEHLQKSSSEDGSHTQQGLCLTTLCGDPVTTGFHCCVSLELLALLLTSVTKLRAFLSHARLAISCNMSLQWVAQTKLSSVVCWVAHQPLCGLLGTLHSSYMSHQCPLQRNVVIVLLETIPFLHYCHPKGACY